MSKIIMALLVALMLTGCSSVRVVGVTPYELENMLDANKKKNRIELDRGIKVNMMFSNFDEVEYEEYVVFNVEIENKSDKDIDILESNIYAMKCNIQEDRTETDEKVEKVVYSDKIIEKIRKQKDFYDYLEKRYQVSTWDNIEGVIAGFNLFSFGGNSGEKYDDYQEEMKEQEEKRVEAAKKRDWYRLKEEEYEKIFLRKGVLNPNEKISGKVYFRRDIDAEILKVYFPIENNEYLFKFKLILKQ